MECWVYEFVVLATLIGTRYSIVVIGDCGVPAVGNVVKGWGIAAASCVTDAPSTGDILRGA
jgi:hypothetical protein